MNMKQRGWGVEIRKPAVSANGVKTCMGLQTKPLCSTPYIAVYVNLRTFDGIFRYGEDDTLMQGAHEHEAKKMGS